MIKYERNKDLENDYDLEYYIEKVFDSNNFGKFKVIGVYDILNNSKRYICEFLENNYQTVAHRSNILRGGIKNNYIPYVFNIGFLGEINEYIFDNEYYWLWHDMLKRCYDKNYLNRQNTYLECSVHNDWLNFSNFNKDVNLIVGFEEMKKHNNIKFELDKDILIHDNKIYCLENCCFVPKDINVFFCNIKTTNTSGYEGVSYHKASNKYQASIGILGKREYLGVYLNEITAYKVYHKAKLKALEKLLNNEYSFIDKKIKNAMYAKLKCQYNDTLTKHYNNITY